MAGFYADEAAARAHANRAANALEYQSVVLVVSDEIRSRNFVAAEPAATPGPGAKFLVLTVEKLPG